MEDVIQRTLLAGAAKRIRLMPATSRLLRHDDDGFQVPSAVTVFKGRPPSLPSDQAVATFLGIDVDLYWKLLDDDYGLALQNCRSTGEGAFGQAQRSRRCPYP